MKRQQRREKVDRGKEVGGETKNKSKKETENVLLKKSLYSTLRTLTQSKVRKSKGKRISDTGEETTAASPDKTTTNFIRGA